MRHIEGLFKNPRMLSNTLAEIPVIGGMYIADLEHSHLLPRVCAALCACVRFRRDGPVWAPDLPLREGHCKMLENDVSNRCRLVGYYGSSLRWSNWDYDEHPSFAAFCSGLLACSYAPGDLRNDLSLRREYPSRPLDGLCDGWLAWRNPEDLARDRHMKALGEAADARAHGRIG
jgi:hypothetical protein